MLRPHSPPHTDIYWRLKRGPGAPCLPTRRYVEGIRARTSNCGSDGPKIEDENARVDASQKHAAEEHAQSESQEAFEAETPDATGV
jgi:hypothetical protein